MGMSVIELGRKFEKEYIDLLERLKNIEASLQHIYTGTTPPDFIPSKLGDMYINTEGEEIATWLYIAKGTQSLDDWYIL